MHYPGKYRGHDTTSPSIETVTEAFRHKDRENSIM